MLDRLYAVKRPIDYRKRSIAGKVQGKVASIGPRYASLNCLELRDQLNGGPFDTQGWY